MEQVFSFDGKIVCLLCRNPYTIVHYSILLDCGCIIGNQCMEKLKYCMLHSKQIDKAKNHRNSIEKFPPSIPLEGKLSQVKDKLDKLEAYVMQMNENFNRRVITTMEQYAATPNQHNS